MQIHTQMIYATYHNATPFLGRKKHRGQIERYSQNKQSTQRDPTANGMNSDNHSRKQRGSTKNNILHARDRLNNTDLRPHSTTDLKPAGDRRRDLPHYPYEPAARSGNCKREGSLCRRTNLPGDLGRARSRSSCSPSILLDFGRGEEKRVEWLMRGRLPGFKKWVRAGWVGRSLDPVYVSLREWMSVGRRRCTWNGCRRWACARRLKLPTCNRRFGTLFQKRKS